MSRISNRLVVTIVGVSLIDGDPEIDQTDAKNDDAENWLYNYITVI